MIQANELRIGNWIADRGGKQWQIDHWEYPNKVASIEPYLCELNGHYIYGHPLTEELDYLQPIPLTPEILEKCGFEKGVSEWYNKNYFTDCMEYAEEMQLQVNLKSFRCGIFDVDFGGTNAMTANPIKYLHQLQNLYYALTGEELNYQP